MSGFLRRAWVVMCWIGVAVLAACGGGASHLPLAPPAPTGAPSFAPTIIPSSNPSPARSAAPTPTPTATPTPTPMPTPRFVDESQGLNPGARPYAIYAGGGGVWFTDRGTQKAIGHMPSATGSALQEVPTADGADPLEITYTSRNDVVFSQASGSSFGSLAVPSLAMSQIALDPIPRGPSQRGVAADRNGNVYIAVGTDYATIGQGIYTYDFTTLATDNFSLTDAAYDFDSVIVDDANQIWVTEPNREYVEKWDRTTLLGTQFPVRPAVPTSLAEGSDNLMYFVDDASGSIMQLRWPPEPPVPFTASCSARYITAGRNNDVWFTEPDCNSIGRLSLTTHTITEFRNDSYPGGHPDHIAVDTAGNVWFTDASLHKIFVYGTY